MAVIYRFNPLTGKLDAINDPSITSELKQNIQDNLNQIRDIQNDFEDRVVLVDFTNIDNIEINLNQFSVRPLVEVWVINTQGVHVQCFPDIQFTETKILIDFHESYESGYLVFRQ